jgi:hypothetical protein
MSAKPSDVMMDLLKELVLLKDLDQKYDEGSRTKRKIAQFEERQTRRQQITDQIKALAEPAN